MERARGITLSAAFGLAATLGVLGLGARSVALADGPAGQGSDVCSPAWINQTWVGLHAQRDDVPLLRQAPPLGPDTAPSAESAALPLAPNAEVTGKVASIKPPNDTYFRSLQLASLWSIGALDAWGISYGGADVTVAIISSGVDYGHPDLAENIWRNLGEVPGNGIDDDGNGYVDDVIGWNFPEQNSDPADFDSGLRGTMLAGIVAAATNNREGIAGVSWYARIMPLKVMFEYRFPNGQRGAAGYDRDIVEAVCYAANNGAQVILLAPTLRDPAQIAPTMERMQAAIDYAKDQGAVVVAPAGDCGGDYSAADRPWCPDPGVYGKNPDMFPANFRNIIGVQSVGRNFELRSRASAGPWVDISAPGEEFMTTNLRDGDCPLTRGGVDYCYVRGFSAVSDLAAAHVAGVAAVIRTVDPLVTPYRTLKYLCQGADKVDGPYGGNEGDWTRNDRYGCGVLDFERTLEEETPRRVHGVTPTRLLVLTDGQRPAEDRHLDNPYLNVGAWHVFSGSEAAWLTGDESGSYGLGKPSWVQLKTSIATLRQENGGRIMGRRFADTLLACPVGSVNAGDRKYCLGDQDERNRWLCPCQLIPYELRVIEHVWQAYLPQITKGERH